MMAYLESSVIGDQSVWSEGVVDRLLEPRHISIRRSDPGCR